MTGQILSPVKDA